MIKPTFPLPIDTYPDDELLYLGMSKQDLKAHQAICELIDNSISATPKKSNFTTEIHIEKKGEDVFIKVSDNGIGISLDDIQNRILRIGGRGSHLGDLNEHGFGLKNSLCVLTGNKNEFFIVTRDKEAIKHDLTYVIKGPFRRGMKVDKGKESDWQKNIKKCTGDTGTRVFAITSMHYFRTVYPSSPIFDTLIERLIEHLGVLYRRYLADPRNEIWVRWRDVTKDKTTWNDIRVQPIIIPYLKAKEENFSIEFEGKKYKASYKWGELDSGKVEDGSSGKPYPLQIYYQNNQKTQGIDVSIRGRIILPHALEYIWPDLNRHNDFNSLAGELLLDQKAFSTVNNKTKLDPNNPIWERLLEKLQHEKYKPTRIGSASYTEKEIRKKLLKKLPSIVSGSTAQENYPTWPGLGVKIDVFHKFANKQEQIYELKAGAAKPLDVYQLVMYWDGRVEEGVRPALGRLVARDANQNIINLLKYWSSRKDKEGKSYKLEFKKIEDLLE